jgi:hypothetical protein
MATKRASENWTVSGKKATVKKVGPIKSGKVAGQLDLVRRICLALPDTYEKLSHGEPVFFAGKRVFAMFSDNHHGDGHIAVWIPAAEGEQARLMQAAPRTYFRPAYVGVKGWVGVDLDHVEDEELAIHLHEAWALIARKKS